MTVWHLFIYVILENSKYRTFPDFFQSLSFSYTLIQHPGINCHAVFLSAKDIVINLFTKFNSYYSVFIDWG